MRFRWSLVFLLVFIVGCGKAPPGDGPITAELPPPPAKTPRVDPAEADQAAKDIISKLKTGTLPVTVPFRKVVGEPLTPDERAQGYSDHATAEWLKRAAGLMHSETVKRLTGTETVAIYELDTGLMRLEKSSGIWQLDWLLVGRPKAAAPLTGWDEFKRFALATFLDAMLTDQFELAESVLSEELKQKLAPPFGRDVGYNRGTLRSKLGQLRQGINGYAVAWDDRTATVSLTGTGERLVVITVKPVPDSPRWLIHSLDVRE